MTAPPSPRRRKERMLRFDGQADAATLVVRAVPDSFDEAVLAIAESALDSADTYAVQRPGGRRVLLYGVSVFGRPPGEDPDELLRRFGASPHYVEATVGDVRAAGFDVLPTGANPGHFDVLLVDEQDEDRPLLSISEVKLAARRLVAVFGEMRPNPSYAGGVHE